MHRAVVSSGNKFMKHVEITNESPYVSCSKLAQIIRVFDTEI